MAFITALTVTRPRVHIKPTHHATHFPSRFHATPSRRCRMSLSVGSPLPSFSLPATGTGTLSADDVSAGPTILYFYPKDATSGCTVEAKDFRDMYDQLKTLGATVVGVSKDDMDSHDKFVADLNLPFPLISDDGTLSEAFGVWKLRKMFGKEYMGIERSTFVLKDGKVVKEWRGMKAGGHAADVLEAVKNL